MNQYKIGFFLLGVLGAFACSQAVGKDHIRPNIILVMADDQGWGDTGYNGHPFVKTPVLDEMSKNGLRFDRFYAGAPVCSPTRASVLTGRNNVRVKVLNHGHYMRPQEETIAEALKRAGYVTGHFGKWHVGSVQKQSPVCPGNSGFDEWITAPNFFDLNPYLSDHGIAKKYKGESSKLVVDFTLDFINKHAKSDKPFFAVTWFASPHSPFAAVGDDKLLYEGVGKYRKYYQETTAMDREVGRLRAGLRKLGIEKNTLIWYCSDNGGLNKATSGGRGQKGAIYEGGLRVPAIIEWPGTISPRITAFPAFTSDMYPTLLDLVGIKPGHNRPLDGISLMDVINGKMTKRPQGMGFWHGFTGGQATFSDKILMQMMEAQKAGIEIAIPERLRKDIDEFPQHDKSFMPGHSAWLEWPWKIHRKQVAKKKVQPGFSLFNLETDPGETENLAETNPEKFEEMKEKLLEWQSSVIDSLNGKDYD